VKKLLKISLFASVVGFIAYFVCSNVPINYQEQAVNGSLVLFAIGWGLSMSCLAFRLGWKSVEKD
jgi:hypothetical protein